MSNCEQHHSGFGDILGFSECGGALHSCRRGRGDPYILGAPHNSKMSPCKACGVEVLVALPHRTPRICSQVCTVTWAGVMHTPHHVSVESFAAEEAFVSSNCVP